MDAEGFLRVLIGAKSSDVWGSIALLILVLEVSWSRSPSGCGFRGVLWVGRIFFAFFFVFISSYFFERTRLAESMRPPLASYTSLLEMRQGRGSETTEAVLGEKSLFIMRHGRGSEATEAVFRLKAKKPLHAGVRTGCHYLISLSVRQSVCVSCQCMCNIRRFY